MQKATRHLLTGTFTNGTLTMNGASGCLTANTTFTSSAVDLSDAEKCILYLKCSDITTSMVTSYQVSYDGTNWVNGAVSISNLDNNAQAITLTEAVLRYVRIVIANAMAAETATVTAVYCAKS